MLEATHTFAKPLTADLLGSACSRLGWAFSPLPDRCEIRPPPTMVAMPGADGIPLTTPFQEVIVVSAAAGSGTRIATSWAGGAGAGVHSDNVTRLVSAIGELMKQLPAGGPHRS